MSGTFLRRLLPVVLSLVAAACSGSSSPAAPNVDATLDDVTTSESAPETTDDAADDVAPEAKAPSTFLPGPYGAMPRDVAGPFTVPTADGDWSFDESWTGEDHTLFIVYSPGTVLPSATDYFRLLFKPAAVPRLLAASPPNVHYVFLWHSDQPGFQAFVAAAQAQIDALAGDARDHWKPRVHFVTDQVDGLTGWLGDTYRERIKAKLPGKRYDAQQFAVDRTQHVREVGMLGRLGASGTSPDLAFLADEPVYYEYEHARDVKLAAEKATVISLFKDQTVVDTTTFDVTLPDAATMASFDTLEVDLTMNCEHHRDGECGAWDYISDLRLCHDAPPSGDAGLDADPDAAPPAPQCDLELARWITSYWRETHWVTDVSGMLAFLRSGGHQTMRWYASKQWDPRPANYVVSLSLRLSNSGKGMKPVSATKLFEGARLDPDYAAKYPPMKLDVPSDAKKAEIYALITGHGSETDQCAEFCNHTHHFSVNGAPEHVLSFPEAQTNDGCRKRISEGVVPNQFGTWYFGRGGWCPGLDVRPFEVDITKELKLGSDNTLSYRALIGTSAPAMGSTYGDIHMTTYLVIWK